MESTLENEVCDYPPGSALRPFLTIIVGGGPAGLAILVRAARIGVLNELCEKENKHDVDGVSIKGLCVIDRGDEGQYGCGRLIEYQVRP